MPRKINTNYRLNDIVEMTGEGLQAQHVHSGFYDKGIKYMPEMPAYIEPIGPEWFDMPIALTPQLIMHEPFIAPEPEPEMVSYAPDPIPPEMFQSLMQQACIEQLHGPMEPLENHEVAEVNQVLMDYGVEPIQQTSEAMLEDVIMEMEQQLLMAQNAPFEMQQMMFDQQMQMMDPFGPMM